MFKCSFCGATIQCVTAIKPVDVFSLTWEDLKSCFGFILSASAMQTRIPADVCDISSLQFSGLNILLGVRAAALCLYHEWGLEYHNSDDVSGLNCLSRCT